MSPAVIERLADQIDNYRDEALRHYSGEEEELEALGSENTSDQDMNRQNNDAPVIVDPVLSTATSSILNGEDSINSDDSSYMKNSGIYEDQDGSCDDDDECSLGQFQQLQQNNDDDDDNSLDQFQQFDSQHQPGGEYDLHHPHQEVLDLDKNVSHSDTIQQSATENAGLSEEERYRQAQHNYMDLFNPPNASTAPSDNHGTIGNAPSTSTNLNTSVQSSIQPHPVMPLHSTQEYRGHHNVLQPSYSATSLPLPTRQPFQSYPMHSQQHQHPQRRPSNALFDRLYSEAARAKAKQSAINIRTQKEKDDFFKNSVFRCVWSWYQCITTHVCVSLMCVYCLVVMLYACLVELYAHLYMFVSSIHSHPQVGFESVYV